MRAIDADSLIKLVTDSTILGDGFKYAFVAIVNGEPTIQPQIIRCKECKHYEHYVDNDEYGVCCNPQWVVGNVGCGVSAIDFCSYAERKTDA